MQKNATNVIGVILAGGKSSRFNSNKAFATDNDKTTFIERIANMLNGVVDNICISASVNNVNEYDNILNSVERVTDKVENVGVLSGVYSVISHFSTVEPSRANDTKKIDGFLFIPVDMPLLDKNILTKLISNASNDILIAHYVDNEFPLYIKNDTAILNKLNDVVAGKNSASNEISERGFNKRYSIRNFISSIEENKICAIDINDIKTDNFINFNTVETYNNFFGRK